MSEPRQNAALQDFWQWESSSQVEVVADLATDTKDYFVPADALRLYFEANGGQRLWPILATVFNAEYFPIHPESILQGHIAVFCILLRIGRGTHIEHFARYEELSDQRLPFDPNHPPPYFPVADGSAFLQQFCQNQWMYCVPVLDSHMLHKYFGPQRLLPITQKEKHGPEGSTTVYKVRLYGPYNKLQPTWSDMTKSQTKNSDADTFILKRYTNENENQYMQDINIFRSLKQPDSITRLCGSFIHGDKYNVLLEYGDKGCLEEYFQRVTPPSRGLDIIKFWAALFKLLDALNAVHTVLGAHGNITPSNVLVMSYGAEVPFDWKFKLADFGQSQVKGKAAVHENAAADDVGFLTYDAPESHMPSNLHDPKSLDVWSLGCIYSEAAIWIAEGYQGLGDYRRQRTAETSNLLNFKGGDCFHDGNRVLETVLEAHVAIDESLRRSDYITKDILDTMVDEMLWDEERPKVKALLRKAAGLISRAQQRLLLNTGDAASTRTTSTNSPFLGPPPLPPPTGQLPDIPRRPVPTRPSATGGEAQYLQNIEKWRSQATVLHAGDSQFGASTSYATSVTGSQTGDSQFGGPTSYATSVTGSQTRGSQFGGPTRHENIPVSSREESLNPESPFALHRESIGSRGSWQPHDNNTLVSPISPFLSRHSSVIHDDRRTLASQSQSLRPNPLNRSTSQQSREPQIPEELIPEPLFYRASESDIFTPSIQDTPPKYSREIMPMSPPNSPGDIRSVTNDQRSSVDQNRTTAPNSPHASTTYSVHISDPATGNEGLSSPVGAADTQVSPKIDHRNGFSLFPHLTPTANLNPLPSSTSSVNCISSNASARSDTLLLDSRPETTRGVSSAPLPVLVARDLPSTDYLSVGAALEWKNAHKKQKKDKVPPLPASHLLEELKERDHVFIVDDALSMKNCWTDVKRVFEGLSYIVKGMSPEGTDLFYTVSYDAWRRKDTSDLCEHLEKKSLVGKTDIKYRLNLQLQSYCVKIQEAKSSKKKKKKIRPMSIYILTNGEWAAGSDPKTVIRDMAKFLASVQAEFTKFQVTIQFISFAQTPEAISRMNDLAEEDFGPLDIVDGTPCDGNVLKMLRGALDHRSKPKPVESIARTDSLSTPRPDLVAQLNSGTLPGLIWGGELA